MIGSSAGSHFTSVSSSHPAIQSGSLQCSHNIAPWASVSFSEIGKNRRCEGPVSMEDDCHLRRSQKLPHNERCVSRSIIMMQGPGVVMPLVWTFAPNVFLQWLQNVTVEFSIHRLSWWNKFLIHIAFIVKLLPHFRSLFQSKVVKNALLHQLIPIHSWSAQTIRRFAFGLGHYHQMLL